jgi:hypothetical protein
MQTEEARISKLEVARNVFVNSHTAMVATNALIAAQYLTQKISVWISNRSK